MAIRRLMCYEKLFIQLEKRHIKKKDLIEKACISTSTFNKLKHQQNVNTDILVRICGALECELNEIAEIIIEENRND